MPSSASSSTAQNSSAAASSAARGPGANDIIQLDDDMSYVRCVRTGHSQQLCRVERVEAGSGDVQVLGIVKRMIDARTGRESLQGQCKLHKDCYCWLSVGSNSDSNMDLLLQWLSSSYKNSAIAHQDAARALKVSLGMRVRDRK